MLTLNRLDAINVDRLYRKLGRACGERVARRRHRLQGRVFLHLHKALLRNRRPDVESSRPRALDQNDEN